MTDEMEVFDWVTPSEDPTVNILFYGPAKTGKSTGACTAPKPIIMMNCDLPNATRFVHLSNPTEQILEPVFPEWTKDYQTPVWDMMVRVTNLALNPQDRIKTVVVDPIGELYRRYLEEVAARRLEITLPQRNAVAVQIERFCRQLCLSPDVNTIFVCHELEVERSDEDEGSTIERLPFTGTKSGTMSGLGLKLQAMVDMIAYTAAIVKEGDEEPSYVAQLVPNKGRRGGDRYNCLNRVGFHDVDVTHWLELIREQELKTKAKAGK